jgi:hypothetical protein
MTVSKRLTLERSAAPPCRSSGADVTVESRAAAFAAEYARTGRSVEPSRSTRDLVVLEAASEWAGDEVVRVREGELIAV